MGPGGRGDDGRADSDGAKNWLFPEGGFPNSEAVIENSRKLQTMRLSGAPSRVVEAEKLTNKGALIDRQAF